MSTKSMRRAAAAWRNGIAILACAGAAGAQSFLRPTPDTTHGVHVFNDQNATGLTAAQVEFCARRYAGTQKQTRADADRYRAVNPDFLVLHYRLGQGLGYRQTTSGCAPNGAFNQIIDGTWVQEWPGDGAVQERWFWHQNGARALQCQWGWYLADPDDAAWRRYWAEEVQGELASNAADGVFADSFLVPNYMGGFQPALPGLDPAFEATWSAKLGAFMDFARARFDGAYRFVPNVGTWLTTRDATDYSRADGVFIEGFGYDAWEQYGLEAFTTQTDRLIGLARAGRIVIAQSYANDTAAKRMYTLAHYLLLKGRHTFLNFELGQAPEWWPEYDVPIGAPVAELPPSTAGLYDAARGVHVREYTNGRVYLNAGPAARTFALGGTFQRATPEGGGLVPANAVLPAAWRVDYASASSLTLAPGQGAVVVVDPTPYELDTPIVFAGEASTISVRNATPGTNQYFFLSRGAGSSAYPTLGVTLGLSHPRLGAIRTADAQGRASWTFTLPATTTGGWLSFQAAEAGRISRVARVHVH